MKTKSVARQRQALRSQKKGKNSVGKTTVATLAVVPLCMSVLGVGAFAKTMHPVDITVSVPVQSKLNFTPFKDLVDEFNRTHPSIHVTIEPNVHSEKTAVQLAAGMAPDVIVFESADDPDSFAYKGGLLPLNPFIKKFHFNLNQFAPGTQASGISPYNGQTYALIFLQDLYGEYYNKKMFTAAGIKKLPTNLAQMVEDGKKMTKFNKKGQIVQLGLDPSQWDQDQPFYIHLFGGQLFNKAGTQSAYDSPAGIRSLAYAKYMYDQLGGYNKVTRFLNSFAEGGTFAGWNTSLGPFASGATGMVMRGDYYTSKLQLVAPHLDYGIFMSPPPPGMHDYGVTPMAGSPVSISKDAKHPNTAFKFIMWLMTTGQSYGYKHNLLVSYWADTPDLKTVLYHPQWTNDVHERYFWHEIQVDHNKVPLRMGANIKQYETIIYDVTTEVLENKISPAAGAAKIAQQENLDLAILGVH